MGRKKEGPKNVFVLGRKWYGRFVYRGECHKFAIGFCETMSFEQARKRAVAVRDDFIRTFETGPKCKNSRVGRSLSQGPLLNAEEGGRRAQRTGAYAELAVAADLLRQSFEVFRPFSNGCEYDLLAVTGEQCIRVEVKFVGNVKEGKSKSIPLSRNLGNFDLLAVVFGDGTILYESDSLLKNSLKLRRGVANIVKPSTGQADRPEMGVSETRGEISTLQ